MVSLGIDPSFFSTETIYIVSMENAIKMKTSTRNSITRNGLIQKRRMVVVVVALLFYIYGKHPRSCRDGQLT